MLSQVVEITINQVKFGVRRDDESDVFVSFCPRFDVYSQGETKEQALEAAADAVCLRLVTAFEHGRFDKVLRQAGLERIVPGANADPLNDEFVSLKFKDGVEVSERPIRVPLGALLHQRVPNNACAEENRAEHFEGSHGVCRLERIY